MATNGRTKKRQEDDEEELTCGICSWRPAYMQRFANPKVFMINFSLIAIIQGSYFSYLVGTASTLEKRFAYSSGLTGFILIADNFSQILISPIIGFLGKHMNKASLIGGGMVFVSFSCWLTAVPYFIYGSAFYTGTFSSDGIGGNGSSPALDLCLASGEGLGLEDCQGRIGSATIWPAYCLIWIASFLNGVGYTAFYTLGFPYVDDNVSKKNAPIYFSKSLRRRRFLLRNR